MLRNLRWRKIGLRGREGRLPGMSRYSSVESRNPVYHCPDSRVQEPLSSKLHSMSLVRNDKKDEPRRPRDTCSPAAFLLPPREDGRQLYDGGTTASSRGRSYPRRRRPSRPRRHPGCTAGVRLSPPAGWPACSRVRRARLRGQPFSTWRVARFSRNAVLKPSSATRRRSGTPYTGTSPASVESLTPRLSIRRRTL